jgi:hypothetical protein
VPEESLLHVKVQRAFFCLSGTVRLGIVSAKFHLAEVSKQEM